MRGGGGLVRRGRVARAAGPARIARPYRDIRFRADKSPYKTSIYATFDRGGYVRFSADGLTAALSFADVDDWETAVGANTPGQSGNPDDPHYRDLFALWANDRYFPVPYRRDRVELMTESRAVLLPR